MLFWKQLSKELEKYSESNWVTDAIQIPDGVPDHYRSAIISSLS